MIKYQSTTPIFSKFILKKITKRVRHMGDIIDVEEGGERGTMSYLDRFLVSFPASLGVVGATGVRGNGGMRLGVGELGLGLGVL